MRQHARDLAHAGIYLCLLVGLLGGTAIALPSFLSQIHQTPTWAAAALESTPQDTTRISHVVSTARQIRSALAKPIPGPQPLPPITAKLAYGYLKPGGKGAISIAAPRKPRLPQAALDAMAMDVSATNFRAGSAVIPELHKVY